MMRWEYARLQSTEEGINVVFTHRQAWMGIAPEGFFQTLRQLGDEGWELVAALPLAVTSSSAPTVAATSSTAGAAGGAGVPDLREMRDPRDLRSAPPSPPTPQPAQPMTLQISPDRWLVFKRPQPEPAEEASAGPGAEMIKGLVGRQLLKGRLPLP